MRILMIQDELESSKKNDKRRKMRLPLSILILNDKIQLLANEELSFLYHILVRCCPMNEPLRTLTPR